MHFMQGEISSKIMRYAAVVGVVRYKMITSCRSSIALDSHLLS